MSIRNISWRAEASWGYGRHLTTFMWLLAWNVRASTSWKPQGLSRFVQWLSRHNSNAIKHTKHDSCDQSSPLGIVLGLVTYIPIITAHFSNILCLTLTPKFCNWYSSFCVCVCVCVCVWIMDILHRRRIQHYFWNDSTNLPKYRAFDTKRYRNLFPFLHIHN
jgi:hypothetical protein